MREEDYVELFDRPDLQAIVPRASVNPSTSLLWLLQRGRCYWCDRMCLQPTKELRRKYSQNRTLPPNFFTRDHVHSRWMGGENSSANIVGACYHCNNARCDAEQKREVGKRVPPDQPEEIRLKRFFPSLAQARTVPFEEGRNARQHKIFKKISCASVVSRDTVFQAQKKREMHLLGG